MPKALFLATTALLFPLNISFAAAPEDAPIFKCMVVYEYEFVSEEFGIGISAVDGKPAPQDESANDELRREEALKFLSTGKLTRRPEAVAKGIKLSPELARRCQIVAESVLEVMIYKDRMRHENEKSGPRPLDQSF